MPGKEVVAMSSNTDVIVRKNLSMIERKDIHPPDREIPPKEQTICLSIKGLKMPMKRAKDETRKTFFMMNITGISPSEKSSAGKRKKGSSPVISYFGNETTVTMNKTVATSLALGSSLWIKVSL